MYILATTSFTAISRLTWEIAAFQRIFTKTVSYIVLLDVRIWIFSCLLFPEYHHGPAVEHHCRNTTEHKVIAGAGGIKPPWQKCRFKIHFFSAFQSWSLSVEAHSHCHCLARHQAWCPPAAPASELEIFLHFPIWPQAATCRMPDTCGKQKKKSRQGETDSLTMSLTWEGCKVRHQQCIYSFKCGRLQDKYSATFTQVN